MKRVKYFLKRNLAFSHLKKFILYGGKGKFQFRSTMRKNLHIFKIKKLKNEKKYFPFGEGSSWWLTGLGG